MVTTKTSNMSQDSNQKNQHTSPSKVKLDIHNEVRENEEEDGDKKKPILLKHKYGFIVYLKQVSL